MSSDKNLIKAIKSLLDTKTNDVFPKKYSVGGKLLSTLSSLIPGVGGIVSPMVSMIDTQRDSELLAQEQMNQQNPLKLNTNIYGKADGGPLSPQARINPESTITNIPTIPGLNPELLRLPKINAFSKGEVAAGNYAIDMYNVESASLLKGNEIQNTKSLSKLQPFREKAMGGLINSNFKQYDTGSHASGQDQNISENGTPSNNNSVAAIQNKENAYTQKGKTYIYSDILTNPETGNKFNMDAAQLNKKYKKADTSTEERNALDFTMDRLSKVNDIMRNAKEMVDKACGGPTKKKALGGNPEDPIPASDNLSWMAQTNLSQPNLFVPKVGLDTAPSFDAMNAGAASLMTPDTSLMTLPLPGLTPPKLNYTPNTVTAPDPTNRIKDKYSDNTAGTQDYNIPAALLKGVALGKSVMDAITPAEKEDPILPDYRKSDSQMYATNIDYTQAKQDAMAAANLASNVNRSASSNLGQFQGRQTNNFSNLSDRIGNISMQEALQRNQQYVQRAGYEQGKAVDTANRLGQNRIFNQQNQANADFADQKLFSEVADIGTQFNKYEYYKDMVTNKKEIAQATINEGIALIGSKYTNFGFDADFMEKIKSGNASVDELVTFMSTVDKVKSKTDKQ